MKVLRKLGWIALLALLFGCQTAPEDQSQNQFGDQQVQSLTTAGKVRTVVYIYKQTVSGQDIFIKGGHDADLVNQGYYPSMAEDITYNNTLNTTTASIKSADTSLDWFTESALDWTTSSWPADWGTKRTYATDGYGEDPENQWGNHWWKFDVMMDGSTGEWFEFKAFMRENGNESWENDITQVGTPYQSRNHWGKKGYITVVTFGSSDVQFIPLQHQNQAPVANAGSDIVTYVGQSVLFDASGSGDADGTIASYVWDNGMTGVSPSKTYDTAGTYTVSLTVTDNEGATATDTVTVTVKDSTGLIVHFKKPSNWAGAYIHIWNVINPTTWSSCPAMTTEGNGWYSYVIQGESQASLLFKDAAGNTGNKTGDLFRDREGWYDNGVWTDYDPNDDVLPTVNLTAPANGANLTGVATLTATASDNIGVAKVEFYYDDKLIGEDVSAPYEYLWNTAYAPNGSHAIYAKAIDVAGNEKQSSSRTVSTANANMPPVADAGRDLNVQVGGIAYFNGSGSYDPNGSIVSYQWSNGLSGSSPTKVYAAEGTFTVTLTVTDNDGATSSDTVVVKVTKGLPRGDFRQETIYFLMTTRFYDGDPSNNAHCWDDGQAGNPDSDPAWRGDFEGIMQKLDYIKALGFSAIWITPVVKNASGYDYHGYHAINFSEVDPRYRSSQDATAEDTYQRLINAVHAKGMRLIQDIVLNHTGNFGEENLRPLFRRNEPTDLSDPIDTALTKIAPAGILPDNYDSLTPGNQFQARIAALRDPLDSDQLYHHHEFKGGWEQYEVQIGSIAGDCQDLNTENPTVDEYLRNAYYKYIDMGVDAFRIDTVKHISRLTFNKEFIPQFKARGGDNFFMFGEVCTRYRSVWNSGIPAISAPFYTWKESQNYSWGSRTVNEASAEQNYNDNSSTGGQPTSGNHYLNGNSYHTPDWSMRSGLDVIDFPMHWSFKNAYDAYNMALGGDQYYNDATWNVTYVDSHDYAPDGAPENERFAGTQDTWAENLSLIFTFRGIPTVYYGSEIEFQKGKPIDVGPNSPLSETGRAYYGAHLEGNVTASDFGVYTASGEVANTLSYPLAQHVRRLNLIRRAIPALQKGQYSTQDISGGMAYKRRYTADGVDSFALITVSGSADFYGLPGGTYVDAVTGDTKVVPEGGSLHADCYGKGNLRVYVLNGPGKIGESGTYLK